MARRRSRSRRGGAPPPPVGKPDDEDMDLNDKTTDDRNADNLRAAAEQAEVAKQIAKDAAAVRDQVHPVAPVAPVAPGVPSPGGRRTRRRHRTRRTRRRGGSRKVDRRHVLLEIGKHLTRSKAMFHATRKHYTHEVAEHTRKGLPDNDKIVHMKKWLAENGSRH